MIILITGASHTGKTALAQRLLEKYHYPYLSIDHLKMGLIRNGNTLLTPMSDDNDLTAYLWPIVCEMVKTAIENDQNLIVEGCYIPFDWEKYFSEEYLEDIRYYCLVMSEKYIRSHFCDIKKYASVIENRMEDEDCTLESVLADNAKVWEMVQKYHVNYILIDDAYNIDIDLQMRKVIVIGCPGSGKSTFARALQEKTGLPLYYLDRMYWNEDKTVVPRPIFLERLQEAMSGECWIIDGNYGSTMELRMQACDTVFFLDYPAEVCLKGIEERKGKQRPDMPWIEKEGEEDAEFRDFVRKYNEESRPQVVALLEKYKDKNIVIFRSREEADGYLGGLAK